MTRVKTLLSQYLLYLSDLVQIVQARGRLPLTVGMHADIFERRRRDSRNVRRRHARVGIFPVRALAVVVVFHSAVARRRRRSLRRPPVPGDIRPPARLPIPLSPLSPRAFHLVLLPSLAAFQGRRHRAPDHRLDPPVQESERPRHQHRADVYAVLAWDGHATEMGGETRGD